jgi:hypothetical protein
MGSGGLNILLAEAEGRAVARHPMESGGEHMRRLWEGITFSDTISQKL